MVSQQVKKWIKAEFEAHNFVFQIPDRVLEETKTSGGHKLERMSSAFAQDEVMPDLAELLVFADLVLMQKLRNHCSFEFLQMIDIAIQAELEDVLDLHVDNPSTIATLKTSLMSELNRLGRGVVDEEISRMIQDEKLIFVMTLRNNFNKNACKNHDMFKGLSQIPSCILEEVMQQFILVAVEQVFAEVTHDLFL